jgi:probable HAF family extracellular repeat protein
MRHFHPRHFSLFALLLTLCSASSLSFSQDQSARSISDPQNQPPSVSYVTLNYPGTTHTIAFGINNLNAIVGTYTTNAQGYGFLYVGGKYKTLSYPGGTGTEAVGINDTGEIVGSYSPSPTKPQAEGFILKAGVYSEIRYPGSTNTFPSGINNAGDIVGQYDDTSNVQHGFLYSGSVYSDIDPPGSVQTLLGGINSLGEIVGVYCVSPCKTFQAFSYLGGTYTDINLPSLSQLWGVNTAGDIVGNWSSGSGGGGDFFYNASTQMFVPFNIDNTVDTSAQGVNDNCAIVGYYTDPTTSNFNGFYIRSSSCK